MLFSLLLLLFMLAAGLATGISPTYPFQEIRQRQERLEYERGKLAYEKQDYRNQRKLRETRYKMAARQRELGKGLLDSGFYTDAEEAFAMALALDDTDWRAALGHFKARTLRLAANDEYDPAVIEQHLDMVLRNNPGDSHAHTMLGELLANVDSGAAEIHYRRAIAEEPKAAHARFGLSEILIGRGEYQAARTLLEEAVALVPQRPLYRTSLAYVLTRIEDFPTAVEHYRHALALDSEQILSYFELARALRMAREPEEAYAYHQMGVALLERKQVSDLPKNRSSWTFHVIPVNSVAGYSDATPYTVYLDRYEQKRVYGRLEMATSEFLLGQEEEALRQIKDLPDLPAQEWNEIEWLVAQELQALSKNQLYLAGTIESFLKILSDVAK
uniref:Tetratricopeptide repeat-containing protein n=1 Tax=Candidatus Kentrum sp. FM TaxID=2126340 RepID=A0A450WM85_9GAMM|nr:MAG: Tetratricopeptide repeat-containing protein [Candidatus Kentron sp. FM]VFJ70280.1 MAG: Tetratricopeptide repeat-containing protein [Candidatus Kentron sp. FM]VFK18119.1 MAG: Tetratricopeptide repeat-containing protein [Candidatus Kentron sp. FM]